MDLNLRDASVPQIRAALTARAISSSELVDEYVDLIAARDQRLGSILRIDPTAPCQVGGADHQRPDRIHRLLAGIPVLVKDNIAVTGMPTTAGSRALAGSSPSDATLVARLRAAGATILGKANLSEWANFRSTRSTSGWSAVGGQTRNPHVLDRGPSGSSSGCAAAVAAGFVPLAVGTETDGSILSPAGACGVVGFKPGRGTVPGGGIVPISSAQDIAGPIGRHVADAAVLYAALSDTAMPSLSPAALRGARVGVWTPPASGEAAGVLNTATDAIQRAGAETVSIELAAADIKEVEESERPAVLAEFRHEIDTYLATTIGAAVSSLAELIDFNRSDDVELSRFGQELFEQALLAPPLTDPHYRKRRKEATERARTLINRTIQRHGLDAIVTLTNTPAQPINYAAGDPKSLAAARLSAVSGYPSITVPGGSVGPLPVGITLFAPAGADTRLLQLAYAFEQITQERRRPQWLPSHK